MRKLSVVFLLGAFLFSSECCLAQRVLMKTKVKYVSRARELLRQGLTLDSTVERILDGNLFEPPLELTAFDRGSKERSTPKKTIKTYFTAMRYGQRAKALRCWHPESRKAVELMFEKKWDSLRAYYDSVLVVKIHAVLVHEGFRSVVQSDDVAGKATAVPLREYEGEWLLSHLESSSLEVAIVNAAFRSGKVKRVKKPPKPKEPTVESKDSEAPLQEGALQGVLEQVRKEFGE